MTTPTLPGNGSGGPSGYYAVPNETTQPQPQSPSSTHGAASAAATGAEDTTSSALHESPINIEVFIAELNRLAPSMNTPSLSSPDTHAIANLITQLQSPTGKKDVNLFFLPSLVSILSPIMGKIFSLENKMRVVENEIKVLKMKEQWEVAKGIAANTEELAGYQADIYKKEAELARLEATNAICKMAFAAATTVAQGALLSQSGDMDPSKLRLVEEFISSMQSVATNAAEFKTKEGEAEVKDAQAQITILKGKVEALKGFAEQYQNQIAKVIDSFTESQASISQQLKDLCDLVKSMAQASSEIGRA
jgi:hypothetical protein